MCVCLYVCIIIFNVNYKGCPYRHSASAQHAQTICSRWLNKNCRNVNCSMRHPSLKGSPARSQSVSSPARSQSVMELRLRSCRTNLGRSCLSVSDAMMGKECTNSAILNKKQLLIKNLNPSSNEASVRAFIRELSDIDPTSVKFSHDRTAVMVGCKNPVFDVNELKKELIMFKSLPMLDGVAVELHPVPFCDQALIVNIPEYATKNDIASEIRKITGPQSISQIDFVSQRNYAIVKFSKSTHLKNLWGKTLQIGQTKLSFYFYDGDFMSDEIYEIIHGRSKTINLKVDEEEIMSFVTTGNGKAYKFDLKKALKDADFRIIHENGECYIAVHVQDYSTSLEADLRSSFRRFLAKFERVKVCINPEIVELSKNEIEIEIANLRILSYCLVKRYGSDLVITGEKGNAQQARLQLEKALRKSSKSEDGDQEAVANVAHVLQKKFPNFQREQCLELLKTEQGILFVNNLKKNSVCWQALKEKDKRRFAANLHQGFFQLHHPIIEKSVKFEQPSATELFKKESYDNLRHCLLNKSSVASSFRIRQSDGFASTGILNVLKNMYAFFRLPAAASSISVELIIGNIAEQQGDVIVNSTSGGLDLLNSCSQALLGVAGHALQEHCSKHVRINGSVSRWSFIETNGGDLNCKKVYHVVLGKYDSQKLKDLIMEVLTKAGRMGYRSLVFPFLGTGVLAYDRQKVARIFDETILDYAKQNPSSSINVVKIVAYEKDSESVSVLKTFFSEETGRPEKKMPVSVVEMNLIGFRVNDLNEANRLVQKYVEDNIVKTSFRIAALTNCSAREKEQLFDFAKENKVKLGIDQYGQVNIEGTPNANTVVMDFCYKLVIDKVGGSTENLPSTWESMPKDSNGKEKPYHLVELPVGRERQDVVRTVRSSADGTIRAIVKVWRVQNPQLYKSYIIKKQAMDASRKSTNNERSLFHGTSKDSCDLICHHGFNRSYAGKHAAAYGDGNYFAVNARYSSSYAKSHSDGYKYMYLAKVLVGEFTQGQKGMKTPPVKGYADTEMYDSVVDNTFNPSIFVVFPDNQTYPEYLICFK